MHAQGHGKVAVCLHVSPPETEMFFTCFLEDYDLSLFFLNRSSKANYRMAHSSLFSCTFSVCKESGIVSHSPWQVDFAIGLVNSVFNLPNGQVMFFEEFE